MFKKLPITAGIIKDNTSLSSEGYWYDGNNVRFFRGKPEVIGGWEKFNENIITGIGRAIIPLSTYAGEKYLCIGTNEKVYVSQQKDQGGQLYNITPATSTGTTFSITIATVSGSKDVIVTHASHGRLVGDWVSFSNQSSAYNGITLSGDYKIIAVTANTYTVTHTSAASGTGSDTRTINYVYEIPVGSSTGALGFGWGVGDWGEENWGDARTSSSITINPRIWSLSKFGDYILGNTYGSGLYAWDSTPANRMTSVTQAPDRVDYSFVSAERFSVLLGTKDYGGNTYSPLLVRWSNIEDYTDWTPTAVNFSGEFPLQSGSEIRGGGVSKQHNLIWTDTSIYSMRFTGDLESVYSFSIVGTNCGLIGSKAWADVDGNTFWMGNNKKFFLYDGSSPKELSCSVSKYVFDNISESLSTCVVCGVNSRFNEVIWFYCDESVPITTGERDINKYVAFNYVENAWYIGNVARTSWHDGTIYGSPTAIGTDRYAYSHEIGYNADGSAIDNYIETALFDVDDGEKVVKINRISPDVLFKQDSTSITPSLDIKLSTSRWANLDVEQEKDLVYYETTDKIDTRAQGRVAKVRISSGTAGVWWRVSDIRLDISEVGNR